MIQVVVYKHMMHGHSLASLKKIHSLEEEEIALFGNFKKCGLKYHLNCINYGQSKLVNLFVITIAILLPIFSLIHHSIGLLFTIYL